MKPPVGAITERDELVRLVGKAKTKPRKLFLVWFTAQKWTLTIIELNASSYINREAIYDVAISNYHGATSCSFSPIIKDATFTEKYWYFRNYWLAYGYLCQIRAKQPDSYM